MKSKKEQSTQGISAMYSVLGKSKSLKLLLDIQLELFDRMIIVPVLTYGCEVWGTSNNAALEKVYLMHSI